MPDSYTVFIEERAQGDMEQAYLWLVENAPEYAADWFNSLLDSVAKLESFPERCPLAPENESGLFTHEIRQLLHGKRQHKYRILYWIDGDSVRVIRIVHGARKWLHE